MYVTLLRVQKFLQENLPWISQKYPKPIAVLHLKNYQWNLRFEGNKWYFIVLSSEGLVYFF